MNELKEIQLALRWFNDKGIDAYVVDNSSLYVSINDTDIEISNSEISWRAELMQDILSADAGYFII
jgi:hypothetical protein